MKQKDFRRMLIMLFLTGCLKVYAQLPATTQDGRKVILYDNGIWQYAEEAKTLYEYFPRVHRDDILIHHTAYSLVYDTVHRLARWVLYQTHREQLENAGVERYNKFHPDPLLWKYTQLEEDYKNSGYDRGHLAPAADMAFSEITMKESFYYSNVSPQVPSFNRGIWKKLEEQGRKWGKKYDKLIIVCGPVLTESMSYIGKNRVSVPEYFYKIFADLSSREKKMIGFIIPNNKSGKNLEYYVVSVDSIEKVTHIDFFPSLQDSLEEKLERRSDVRLWEW
jgi:endonuclease G